MGQKKSTCFHFIYAKKGSEGRLTFQKVCENDFGQRTGKVWISRPCFSPTLKCAVITRSAPGCSELLK